MSEGNDGKGLHLAALAAALLAGGARFADDCGRVARVGSRVGDDVARIGATVDDVGRFGRAAGGVDDVGRLGRAPRGVDDLYGAAGRAHGGAPLGAAGHADDFVPDVARRAEIVEVNHGTHAGDLAEAAIDPAMQAAQLLADSDDEESQPESDDESVGQRDGPAPTILVLSEAQSALTDTIRAERHEASLRTFDAIWRLWDPQWQTSALPTLQRLLERMSREYGAVVIVSPPREGDHHIGLGDAEIAVADLLGGCAAREIECGVVVAADAQPSSMLAATRAVQRVVRTDDVSALRALAADGEVAGIRVYLNEASSSRILHYRSSAPGD